MEEWNTFAALAVEYVGMPREAMPLYEFQDSSFKFQRKAERLLKIILGGRSGSKITDTWEIAKVFPLNTVKFLPGIFWHVNWMKIKEKLLNG